MKSFNIMYNIGRAKYCINTNDGIKKHSDGSDFYGIYLFSNKRKFERKLRELTQSAWINERQAYK